MELSKLFPPGWGLCDGTKGAPDLRGRFIRMYNPKNVHPAVNVVYDKTVAGISRTDHRSNIFQHEMHNIGGTDHQQLQINELPKHSHSITVYNDDFNGRGGQHGLPGWANNDSKKLLKNRNTDITGVDWGHNVQPPYYVLAWIMKL